MNNGKLFTTLSTGCW